MTKPVKKVIKIEADLKEKLDFQSRDTGVPASDLLSDYARKGMNQTAKNMVITEVTPDVTGVLRELLEGLRGDVQRTLAGQRQLVAGLAGLTAGQGEIAGQVGAARHAEAVLAATRQVLESSPELHGDADYILGQVSEVVMEGLPELPPSTQPIDDEWLEVTEEDKSDGWGFF